MNQISKLPIDSIGYNFISNQFIPKGKDEYYLRNKQNRTGIKYRQLTKQEKTKLLANGNTADNWDHILVEDSFMPNLVRGCSFYGLVRIGKLEQCSLEFHNLRLPIGLYNSTIVSCDLGNNVVVNNVNMLSHYIIGNEVILANVNEITTTNHAKFGNGVLKQGENENIRTWMEICNENGGRSVLPFNGMLAADAWLWSKYRDDEQLLNKLIGFTDNQFDTKRGYYGKIGDRTVIKNSRIIKDTWIGSDAYIKGANKIKNITINSSSAAKSQIGEGCELVNGIVGFGCRIFYGVKAVRFVMGSNSQLKYGARLINSYLGDNSTISCCEVLNSLIFPGHEQHHNNSFLCASVVMGQSNVAAGATIGSNHNSRGADGELIAGRGFWPGLCVSLKHNSRFASFTILAKGDYASELDIPIPFSLVNNDVANDRLVVMPGYWFLFNLYALCRNELKYTIRDKRTDKSLLFEYDFLAPDSVNEILNSLTMIEKAVGAAWAKTQKNSIAESEFQRKGETLLSTTPNQVDKMEIIVTGFENSKRKTVLIKVAEAYHIFKQMVSYYGTCQLIEFIKSKRIRNWQGLLNKLPKTNAPTQWINLGGQLMPASSLQQLMKAIKNGKINKWDDVHQFYVKKSNEYNKDKLLHAWGSLLAVKGIRSSKFTKKLFLQLLQDAIVTREWLTEGIYVSRAKDYHSHFRKMIYSSDEEMNKVVGTLADNSFILQQRTAKDAFTREVKEFISLFY